MDGWTPEQIGQALEHLEAIRGTAYTIGTVVLWLYGFWVIGLGYWVAASFTPSARDLAGE